MTYRTFDALFDDITKTFLQPDVSSKQKKPHQEYMRHKTENGYRLEVPAIGASKNDVSVKIEDQMLKIKITPTVHSTYSKEFECEWLVGEDFRDNVGAKLENGLLTVTLNYKKPDPKKSSIDVTVN